MSDTAQSRSRVVLRLNLLQLAWLQFDGIDVRPNCHAWVSDESIRAALTAGNVGCIETPHSPETDRAARVAGFAQAIVGGRLRRRKLCAELYFRGTALRLKIIDGNTRWRAMQFLRDQEPFELHVFGEESHLANLPAEYVAQ